MQWKKLKKKIRRFCRYIYTRFVFRRFDVLKVRNFKRISAVANKLEPHDFRVLYERKIWRKSKSLQINWKIRFLANISSLNLFLKSITRYLLKFHLKSNCSSWVFPAYRLIAPEQPIDSLIFLVSNRMRSFWDRRCNGKN